MTLVDIRPAASACERWAERAENGVIGSGAVSGHPRAA